MKRVFVTGANSGIGLALSKQLCAEHGCHVYLGSRSSERGAAAVKSVQEHFLGASVELVVIDVSTDASVAAAAAAVQDSLPTGEKLYAVVNNAGTGLAHKGVTPSDIVNVNLRGAKRVCDAFVPLLGARGRVVNTGSGAGPMFVSKQTPAFQKRLCGALTWEEIEAAIAEGLRSDSMGGYGVSKALLSCYTMQLAQQHPALMCCCLSPGFIATAIVAGFGAKKQPEEGTVSLRHCLFADLPAAASGWFWGSDAQRSPLHVMRNPGEPMYDGSLP